MMEDIHGNPQGEINMRDQLNVLSESELEQLNDFLLDRIADDAVTEGMDEGMLDVSELDGFFTAIISGPAIIQPSQWMPVIWGDFEPEWESDKEFKNIISLMIRHMNGIVTTLMEQPEDFEPFYLEWVGEDRNYPIVDGWCEGYMSGVALAALEWTSAGEEMAALLAPVLAFTQESGWRGHDLSEKEVRNLQNSILANVRKIHAYWLMQRSEDAPSSQPVRRSEPRIGRNDPCPCGSGKKYKKCCLH